MISSHAIVIRNAIAADADTLVSLAALDSRKELTGPAILCEVDGIARAALDLHDGSVAADPFVRTAELVELLQVHLRNSKPRSSRKPRAAAVVRRMRAAHA